MFPRRPHQASKPMWVASRRLSTSRSTAATACAKEPQTSVRVGHVNACARAHRHSNRDSVCGDRSVRREEVPAGKPAQQAPVGLGYEIDLGHVSATDPIAFARKTLGARMVPTRGSPICSRQWMIAGSVSLSTVSRARTARGQAERHDDEGKDLHFERAGSTWDRGPLSSQRYSCSATGCMGSVPGVGLEPTSRFRGSGF